MRTSALTLLVFTLLSLATSNSRDYFTIKVVDSQTGRGVPLVELRTTNAISYYTDSNGLVAFREPGLMDQTVYFSIKSDGYEFPKDSLGNQGAALKTTPGGKAELKIRRTSIAERLYRITGEGIYRDSALVGAPTPLQKPLLNAQVMGQDGGLAIPYRGKLYWFWGDTTKVSYALGNFGISGATSEWPAAGGLGPDRGIDLSYFEDKSGFSRTMLPSADFPGPGPRWIGGLKIVTDERGSDRLLADYVRIKNLGEAYERGEAIFNDQTNSFKRLAQFDLDNPMSSACWGGHAVRIKTPDTEYYYQGYASLLCRMKPDLTHIKDPALYEGFSPLVAGSRYSKTATPLDRTPDGRLQYAWKKNTPPLSPSEESELIAAGKIKASESLFQLRSVDTDARVKPHAASIQWNDFRKRWIMIVQEDEGLVYHGTIWFAEADTPLGPWVYAKTILRHEKYNFYNPVQHTFFDQNGGRTIYFEGTYAGGPGIFAAGEELTSRYDYNQIMYRLSLDDPRLSLPVPVYRVRGRPSGAVYMLREELAAADDWDRAEAVPFFAVPPGYVHNGLIPIFASLDKHGMSLHTQPPDGPGQPSPLFYALPLSSSPPQIHDELSGQWLCTAQLANGSDHLSFNLDLQTDGQAVSSGLESTEKVEGTFKNRKLHLLIGDDNEAYVLDGQVEQHTLNGTWRDRHNPSENGNWHCERPSPVHQAETVAIVPLYEYTRVSDESHIYSTNPNLTNTDLQRSLDPVCRVWRNPAAHLIFDPHANPIPLKQP